MWKASRKERREKRQGGSKKATHSTHFLLQSQGRPPSHIHTVPDKCPGDREIDARTGGSNLVIHTVFHCGKGRQQESSQSVNFSEDLMHHPVRYLGGNGRTMLPFAVCVCCLRRRPLWEITTKRLLLRRCCCCSARPLTSRVLSLDKLTGEWSLRERETRRPSSKAEAT